jgi:processive rubber oxygenase RoxA-like protein
MAHAHLIRLSASLLAAAAAVSSCSREPASPPQPAAARQPVMRLSADTNGLLPAERQRYYHLSEGGELYPVDWLLALEVEATGPDGRPTLRPFLENIERFGLIPDDKSPENPYGLPVGLTVAPSLVTGTEMVGLNCTACHVGEIWHRGTRVRIDGGPGMALVNGFIKGVIQETERTLTHPVRGVKFLEALKETRVRRPAGLPPPAPSGTGARIDVVRDSVRAHLAAMKSLGLVADAANKATPDGYGRVDAFGQGRNELFGSNPKNIRVPNASVSLPHTWGMENTLWLQWGANTNSVIERNIGQALGVGAWVDTKTWDSSVRIDNLNELEHLTYKITPPSWPASFPPVDQAKADQGRALFTTHCATCHERWTTTPTGLRQYQLFALDHVKTDPATATAFEAPVTTSTGDQPFPLAAFAIVANVKAAYYKRHNVSAEQAAQYENVAKRTPPQIFRLPLQQANKYPDTRGQKVYRAKTLVGIWATAPFLHNGSVPTIYDLLKPAADRPKRFPTGQREYDTIRLGYEQDGSKFVRPAGMVPFDYDTTLPGNSNSGHEWEFYPGLTDGQRFQIIEFLKTYTKELYPTGAPAAPASGANR